jgi:hypothetical protein
LIFIPSLAARGLEAVLSVLMGVLMKVWCESVLLMIKDD